MPLNPFSPQRQFMKTIKKFRRIVISNNCQNPGIVHWTYLFMRYTSMYVYIIREFLCKLMDEDCIEKVPVTVDTYVHVEREEIPVTINYVDFAIYSISYSNTYVQCYSPLYCIQNIFHSFK